MLQTFAQTPKTPNQQYLLQLAESANLTAALIAGATVVLPFFLSKGPVDWLQVLIAFVVTVVLIVSHSIIAHINNPALRLAVDTDLTAFAQHIPQIIPGAPAPTIQTMESGYQPPVDLTPSQPPQGGSVIAKPAPIIAVSDAPKP